jgi:hypothetical protein
MAFYGRQGVLKQFLTFGPYHVISYAKGNTIKQGQAKATFPGD